MPFVVGRDWLWWGLVSSAIACFVAYVVGRLTVRKRYSFVANRLDEFTTLGIPVILWALPSVDFGLDGALARSAWLPLLILAAIFGDFAATGPNIEGPPNDK